MKNSTTSNLLAYSGLALAMTLGFCSPVQAQSAAPAHGSMMNADKMAERHQAMRSQREKMMTEMKAQDTELQTQLARIKSAPEKQKVDLLVAVVTSMVEQRKAMHAQMDEMMNQKMADMLMENSSMSSHPMMGDMHSKPTGTTDKQD